MAHDRDSDSSESKSAVSQHGSAVSSEDSSQEEQDSPAVSPPHKKSRKAHKSHKKKHRHSSESEPPDDEKENRRKKKKKSSHERRELMRERLRHVARESDSPDGVAGRGVPDVAEVPGRHHVEEVKQSRWQSVEDEEHVQQLHRKRRDGSGAEWRHGEDVGAMGADPSRGSDSEDRQRDRREHRHRHKHRHRQRERSAGRTKQRDHKRRLSVSPAPPVRVKEEPLSDTEHERRRRRRRRDADDDEQRRRRGGQASPDEEHGAAQHPSRQREPKLEPGERDHSRRTVDGGQRRRRRDDGGERRPDVAAADDGGWGLQETAPPATGPDAGAVSKEAPNFGLSGKLVEDTNTVNGVVVKYSEPPEARKPKRRWRLYVFKGETSMPTLHIHRQSAFLMGRDRKVADIPIDHPSCSKQHAVLQYRLAKTERPDGSTARLVKPYIIDLESANGTYVNNQRIEAKRYVELLERDVLKFGFSSREYVLLHDSSQGGGDSSGD